MWMFVWIDSFNRVVHWEDYHCFLKSMDWLQLKPCFLPLSALLKVSATIVRWFLLLHYIYAHLVKFELPVYMFLNILGVATELHRRGSQSYHENVVPKKALKELLKCGSAYHMKIHKNLRHFWEWIGTIGGSWRSFHSHFARQIYAKRGEIKSSLLLFPSSYAVQSRVCWPEGVWYDEKQSMLLGTSIGLLTYISKLW